MIAFTIMPISAISRTVKRNRKTKKVVCTDEVASLDTDAFALEGNYIAYPGHGPATTLDEERAANPYVR